jgi:hypothetical protein
MSTFEVTLEGIAREVFTVEAEDETDARLHWCINGVSQGLTGYGFTPVRVEKVED